jgi:predicted ATPase
MRRAEAIGLVDEALRATELTGECWWEAELLNVRARLALANGEQDESEAYFQRSLAVSRRQGAKALELRTSTSVARLRREQGKHAEARDLLTPIYGWFTEGFDLPDLKEAKALLDVLEEAVASSSS